MPLTPEEQSLANQALASLPAEFREQTDPQEAVGAFAKELGASQAQVARMYSNTFITTAERTYLELLAKSRGVKLVQGEGDSSLRGRASTPPDALTLPALTNAAVAVLVAFGVTIPTGYPGFVQLRRDRGYFHQAFFGLGLGYRLGSDGTPHRLIVILPPTTPPAAMTAVAAALNAVVAAGVIVTIDPLP